MSVSRNSPCPCGSGKKYKKCCLAQDEKAAAEQRARHREAQESLIQSCPDYLELDRLSNEANDLIREKRWDEAYEACRRLAERFPDSLDADERFSDYYKQRGDFQQALTHAQAALHRAENPPAWYEPAPELLVELREEIAYLSECIQAGRLVD